MFDVYVCVCVYLWHINKVCTKQRVHHSHTGSPTNILLPTLVKLFSLCTAHIIFAGTCVFFFHDALNILCGGSVRSRVVQFQRFQLYGSDQLKLSCKERCTSIQLESTLEAENRNDGMPKTYTTSLVCAAAATPPPRMLRTMPNTRIYLCADASSR